MALYDVSLEMLMDTNTDEIAKIILKPDLVSDNLEEQLLSILRKYKEIYWGKTKKSILDIKAIFNEPLYYYYINPKILEEMQRLEWDVKFSCGFLDTE